MFTCRTFRLIIFRARFLFGLFKLVDIEIVGSGFDFLEVVLR